MEIREDNKFYIITPLCRKLDSRESQRVIAEILKENRLIGLDLKFVFDCTFDFIEAIKEVCQKKSIGIFNISSDVFATFDFFEVDKFAKIFVSELDFEEDSRQIVNRHFSIV